MITRKPNIGEGVYTVSDMARIFRLNDNRRVRYLFNNYIQGKLETSSKHRFFFGDKRRFVNFETLIHLYIFLELNKRGIAYKEILTAYDALSESLDTPYPFTKVILSTQGKKIIAGVGDSIFTADKKKQGYLKEIIVPLAKKVELIDNEITRFFPLGKRKTIVVDPQIQMGAPVVDGTRINTKVIYQLHEAGENHKVIARMFNLSARQIKDAIEFYSFAA